MLETFEIAEQEEEYRLLVRSLLWPKGFGLFFVECLPAQAERLIQRLQQDILNKKIEVLRFERPIENLYDKVDELLQENGTKIDILCLKGLDKSLKEYIKPGYGGQGNYYKEDTIPPLLGHLNWQRERFRDDFNICFVFFLPKFAIKYFLRRAPDFYDWRSGSFEFPLDKEMIEKSIQEIQEKLQSQEIANLTKAECEEKILELEALIDKEYDQMEILRENKVDFLFKQGELLLKLERYQDAVDKYDGVLAINPQLTKAWISRGLSLFGSKRFEEAVASLDRAIALEPDNAESWTLRGTSMLLLGSVEDALKNFDKAVEIAPDYMNWMNQGSVLSILERYSEAIASFVDTSTA